MPKDRPHGFAGPKPITPAERWRPRGSIINPRPIPSGLLWFMAGAMALGVNLALWSALVYWAIKTACP